MFGIKQARRKPDLLLLVTIFVCLGVVVTTTVSAAPPAANHDPGSRWGLQLEAQGGCDRAWAEWRGCSRLLQHDNGDPALPADDTLRATVSLSSERLPDTDLVWYYTHNLRPQGPGYGLDLRRDTAALAGQDAASRQFGMALKRRYGSLGLSFGLEAEHVDNLTNDPLIYFGTSYGW